LRILPPQIDQLYSQAVEQYSDGNYRAAADTLEEARRFRETARVNALLGWSYWRLEDPKRAEAAFTRAHRSDPSLDDAKLGLAFASMALDHVSTALPLLEDLTLVHPGDNEIRTALGSAYEQSGQNEKAAQVYCQWLDLDPENAAAKEELLKIFGYATYRPDLPFAVPPINRPAQTQLLFRTHGERLQALTGGEWKDIYSVGVNIGPGRPGEFASTVSRDFSTYAAWFEQIGAMHANTIRVYTILPPAFYQALRAYDEKARQPLWLIQEVWIDDAVEDLYASSTQEEFRNELHSTIDVLHGHADIPFRHGHNYGIYTADVSLWTLALAVGREVEPRVVMHTNNNHSKETSYQGRFINVNGANPTEAWFARMFDEAASYELDKYNAQRPLTLVNWPPLDPMTHPTEANYVDELRMRKQHGEVVPTDIPKELNDADAVSVDVAKFRVTPAFSAGLFALFHVYQHWPDFLLHEPSYAEARDAEGTNRYLGYLRELKKAYAGIPLLVGEYGIATSTASAHVQPEGWNNGGLSESQQAALLVRFSKNIRDTGYAGGIVFEWQDEWWKHVHDSFTADFEQPWERNPLWLNRLDPEKQFGLVEYQPKDPVPLLRGNRADWTGAQELDSAQATDQGQLRAIYAASDFAYLYLRLDFIPGTIDWKQTNYWIALNTLPGAAGSRDLPSVGVRLDQGANFLVELSGPDSSRIQVAENYDPNHPFPVPGRPRIARIWRKQNMALSLVNYAPFEDLMIEANPERFARNGTEFPAINYDRSPLPYGTADPARPDFNSNAAWHVDEKQGMIEARIPWGLMLFNDPSQLATFGGTDDRWRPQSRPSPGINVTAFEITLGDRKQVQSALPAVRNGHLAAAPVYTWKKWQKVDAQPVFKPAYYALQKLWGEW
ncbi:MAG: tetratricopeptide repeat protein, partial [Terriglobales bacterium]